MSIGLELTTLNRVTTSFAHDTVSELESNAPLTFPMFQFPSDVLDKVVTSEEFVHILNTAIVHEMYRLRRDEETNGTGSGVMTL